MKKIFVFFMVIAFLLSLCACSTNSSVTPDQIIKDDINKKFGRSDFDYSISHNMDTSTHIDTVTVKGVVSELYYRDHITGTLMYRYNKSNDTWDSYGTPKWESEETEYLAHKYTGKWDGSFKNGGTYNLNISAVDFEKGNVTGSFSAIKSSVSLGGSKLTYELDVSGTYEISKGSDGYTLEIIQSGYAFVFLLSKHYGVQGITIYNARTGNAV